MKIFYVWMNVTQKRFYIFFIPALLIHWKYPSKALQKFSLILSFLKVSLLSTRVLSLLNSLKIFLNSRFARYQLSMYPLRTPRTRFSIKNEPEEINWCFLLFSLSSLTTYYYQRYKVCPVPMITYSIICLQIYAIKVVLYCRVSRAAYDKPLAYNAQLVRTIAVVRAHKQNFPDLSFLRFTAALNLVGKKTNVKLDRKIKT